jgi:septal ring factor EnvC (AmiA/AmiB activator)
MSETKARLSQEINAWRNRCELLENEIKQLEQRIKDVTEHELKIINAYHVMSSENSALKQMLKSVENQKAFDKLYGDL